MLPDEPSPAPFRGFYEPRTTPVPDNFFDEVLHALSGAEVKVLLYIFRRTFGFKRDSDNISLSQMVHGITKRDGTVLDHGTGLGKTSVARALKQLVEQGMVRKTRRQTATKGDEATAYEPVMQTATPVSQNGTGGVPKWDKPVFQNGTHKKQGNKRQSDNKKTVTKHSPIRDLPDLKIDPDLADLIAADILDAMGDEHSSAFYRLVAGKVPEHVIREALATIEKDGGARDPRSLFTYRVQAYALKRLLGGARGAAASSPSDL